MAAATPTFAAIARPGNLSEKRRWKKRARAIAAAVSTTLVERPRPVPPRTAALLGSVATAGVLIAEGDSWFDYPLHDVLKMLEDEHAFDVESVAHRGDRVEDMAFGPGQLEEFSRRLEKVLRTGVVPKAILLSGGGNDIAGDEFGVLLNHAASPIAGLNDDIVTGVIDRRIKTAYVFVIGVITAISHRYVNQPIPIVVHGYDFPVPDGRGFAGGSGCCRVLGSSRGSTRKASRISARTRRSCTISAADSTSCSRRRRPHSRTCTIWIFVVRWRTIRGTRHFGRTSSIPKSWDFASSPTNSHH
jgi:hypothetical protein